MIRVWSPSRLHFGLLDVAAGARWTNLRGAATLPARRFGGVGLTIEQPGFQLSAAPAPEWSAAGPLAGRVLEFARLFTEALGTSPIPPQHFVVEQAAPEHAGLGSGTQLGLAVARALALAAGLPHLDAVELAQLVGRGQRSGLGVHGFAQGGFLVDGGKGEEDVVAPLVARVPFPEEWRVVLALPEAGLGLHGGPERQAFACLADQRTTLTQTEALCRLVLLGLLPALVERDLPAFGEALHDFNVRAGETFAPVQGGTYASPVVAELVAFVRAEGIPGAGQSSWGPAVFAITGDEERGRHLAYRLRERFALETSQVHVTRVCNRGALARFVD